MRITKAKVFISRFGAAYNIGNWPLFRTTPKLALAALVPTPPFWAKQKSRFLPWPPVEPISSPVLNQRQQYGCNTWLRTGRGIRLLNETPACTATGTRESCCMSACQHLRP